MQILASQKHSWSKKKGLTRMTSVSAENVSSEKIIMKNLLAQEASNLDTIALSVIVQFNSENFIFIYE